MLLLVAASTWALAVLFAVVCELSPGCQEDERGTAYHLVAVSSALCVLLHAVRCAEFWRHPTHTPGQAQTAVLVLGVVSTLAWLVGIWVFCLGRSEVAGVVVLASSVSLNAFALLNDFLPAGSPATSHGGGGSAVVVDR